MERICANCGVKSNEDTAFCTKCGTPYPTPEEQQLKIANEHLKSHPPSPQQEAARQAVGQLAKASQTLATIGAFFFMIFLFCVGLFVYFIFFANQSTPTTENNIASDQTITPAATPSNASQFDNGTFIVGTDIQPGTYRTSGGANCYYARLSGFGGTTDDIIANANTNSGGAIVTIAPTDKGFQSSGCATWTQISAAPSSSKKTSTASDPVTQTSPSTNSPTPLHAQINWSAYQAVSFETYNNNPRAYLDSNILVSGVSDSILLPGNSADASNYVEIGDPTQRSLPKLEISVPIQADYSAAVAQLEGGNIYPIRVYGTGFSSQSFSLTNGAQSVIPVIVAQRIDRCVTGFGDMQLTVVYGQTVLSDIINKCSSWQTIFPTP